MCLCLRSRVQKFPASHTKAVPNGECCEGYIVPSMVRLMYQFQVCWNKGRLCWKIANLFYFCHLKKLVSSETFGPYYVHVWHVRVFASVLAWVCSYVRLCLRACMLAGGFVCFCLRVCVCRGRLWECLYASGCYIFKWSELTCHIFSSWEIFKKLKLGN